MVTAQQSKHNPLVWRLAYQDHHWRVETSQFAVGLDLPYGLARSICGAVLSRAGRGAVPSFETTERVIAALQEKIDEIFAQAQAQTADNKIV